MLFGRRHKFLGRIALKQLSLALIILLGCVIGAAAEGSDSIPDIQDSTATKEGQELSLEEMFINGIAVGVTRDSYILVKTEENSASEPLRLRLWALRIDAEPLAVMVLGRELKCRIVYVVDDHTAAQCAIGYQAEQDFECSVLENVLCDGIMMGAVAMAESLTILHRECDSLDLENLSNLYPPPDYSPTYAEQCQIFQTERDE